MTKETDKLPPSAPARLIALLLCADVALVGWIAAVVFEAPILRAISLSLVFVTFGAITFVLVQMFRQGRGEEMLFSLGRTAWLVASALFWAVAAGLIVLALGYGVALSVPAAAPLLLYALAFLSILLMAWSGAKIALGRRRMFLILNNLEKSISMNIPLPRMILAAAESETGMMRRRLIALHDHLDRGEPLDQALVYTVPEIPYGTIRLISAGIHVGCLEHVLEGILRRREDESNSTRPSAGFYWAYPVVLVAVISLLLIAVIPKFEGIFRDFHLQLPPATRALVSFCSDTSALWVFIVVLCLIPMGRAFSMLFPSFRAVSPFSGIFADQIIWWTPVIGGFVRDRGMADLCDITAAAVRLGNPLVESLREAAAAQSNAVMRYRAAAWANAVAEGHTMHEAARYARMPELFSSMLATVRDNESLLQVLGFLWRHYEYRVSRTRAVVQALYVPAIVLIIGSIVAFVGVSMIQPIAMLSEHFARDVLGGF